jgi:putative membrane protein
MWNGTSSGMMGGDWAWPFMGLIPLLFLAAVVLVVVWLVRSSTAFPSDRPSVERGSRALHALQERYARGEIGRDEYMQKKNDIADS